MLTHPVTLYWHQADQLFCCLFFILSTMHEGTTTIFKCLWYDWTHHRPGMEPTKPFGQCWPPIVAFYNQQGLLRTYSLQGAPLGAPYPDPHGVKRCTEANVQRSGTIWSLFVCGISLTSGQLITELFPDCTRSCFSQVVLRRRHCTKYHDMLHSIY